ncbi:DNA-binding protein [Sphingobium sp. JS3065]|uniref:DNA-binding protein n=1 Tax=Sphingobium sp. JS3065 TaxID=2970925 RepID=UPI0022656BB9|nr:DNA-binding protein [Sphingobium sp. JS3065]UZW55094.1 DNA-binding protein [Sphingobium sp. JS3065]
MKKLFQEDVDPVCDELRASGMPMKAINGSLVWTKLGSVGSRSTAYEMVRDWKERRADRSVVQPLLFSEAGRRDLIAAVERIASGELEAERQATAIENAALHDEVEALRQERDDLVKAIGALGVEVDELKEQLQSAVLEAKILAKDRELLMVAKGSEQSGAAVRRSDPSANEPDPSPGFFDQPDH